MAEPAVKITYGNLPADVSLLNEPNMIVKSLTITPARTKSEYKGISRCIEGLEYTNPILTFAFDAWVSARIGLAHAHPGSEVTALANFSGTLFGFDSSVGTMVYEDPASSSDQDNPESIKFNVVHYPFVT